MASVQCPGCRAHLLISGHTTCPRCATPLPVCAPIAATTKYHPQPNGQPLWRWWIGGIALLGILTACALIVYRVVVPFPEKIQHDQVSRALATCQQSIRSTARFDGADTPPFTRNFGKGGEFYFAWPSGSFYFTNQFGAREKMSASCIGTLATNTITQLSINGMDIR